MFLEISDVVALRLRPVIRVVVQIAEVTAVCPFQYVILTFILGFSHKLGDSRKPIVQRERPESLRDRTLGAVIHTTLPKRWRRHPCTCPRVR